MVLPVELFKECACLMERVYAEQAREKTNLLDIKLTATLINVYLCSKTLFHVARRYFKFVL